MKREYRLSECENCGTGFGLNLHHVTYYTRKGQSVLWRENYQHFQTLCRTCHQAEHKAR
jgi:5-methylcytosine-specific restriction endonuclease McrA